MGYLYSSSIVLYDYGSMMMLGNCISAMANYMLMGSILIYEFGGVSVCHYGPIQTLYSHPIYIM